MKISIFFTVVCFALLFGNVLNAQTENKKVEGETQVIIELDNGTVVEDGVIFLKTVGIARTKEQARTDAIREAVRAILFKGVPGSSVKRPLVSDPDAERKHKEYFKAFFKDNGPYLNFIVETQMDAKDRIKVKGGWQIGMRVKVYYRELQKELVNAKIEKPFGF